MANNNPERKNGMTEVRKFWFHELPDQLSGHVIVVDAYASSADMSVLLSKSPQKLIVVNEDNLEAARRAYEGPVLVGESLKLPPEAFSFPNELKAMHEGQVSGKNVLWMSINGSRVFEKAMQIIKDGELLAGAFNNAQALVEYLLYRGGAVSLIMAGNQGFEVVEDRICGELIEARLTGTPFDWEAKRVEAETFVRQYYPRTADEDIPFLLYRLDEFKIVPKVIVNSEGFLEVTNGD